MTNPTLSSIGLLIARIAIGVTFFMHGLQKVFQQGMGATADGFASMGVPLPELAGPTVGLLELVGGVLLVLGAGTRLFAALFAVTSFVALFLVHLPAGFFASDGGVELVLVLGLVSLALAFTGPGRFSIDRLVVDRRGDAAGSPRLSRGRLTDEAEQPAAVR